MLRRSRCRAWTIRASLRPRVSVQIQARDLERGGEGLTGALGDGTGRWRLDVTANEPLLVMGMVRSEAALANISRGAERCRPAAHTRSIRHRTRPVARWAGIRHVIPPCRLATSNERG